MHESSLAAMSWFVENYVSARYSESLFIVDHGSADVNGSYRHFFTSPQWTYVGCDLDAGPNVDIVLEGPYEPLPFDDDSVDVLISGQVLEHVAYPWVVVNEWARVLRPGGILCVIVPGAGPEHNYPIDCYRYLPEGLVALIQWSGLRVTDIAQSSPEGWSDGSEQWLDSLAVAVKDSTTTFATPRLDRQRALWLSTLSPAPARRILHAPSTPEV